VSCAPAFHKAAASADTKCVWTLSAQSWTYRLGARLSPLSYSECREGPRRTGDLHGPRRGMSRSLSCSLPQTAEPRDLSGAMLQGNTLVRVLISGTPARRSGPEEPDAAQWHQ
jgi:hypothetical protein